tara:strand:+ start:6913 stop:7935 length:1023 start_codon:yes stop_codon:yes gene_type:complete
MSVFLIFLSVPIILIINKFLINKNLLLNFSGEIHQGFASKTRTPLSGGIAIMIFLFINLLPENINILVFFSLVFVLGIISDTHFIKSPLVRVIIQFLIIFSLILFFDIKIRNLRQEYLNYFLTFNLAGYLFLTFCFLILINGSNFIDGCNTLVLGYYILILFIIEKLNFFYLSGLSENFFFQFLALLLILYFFNLLGKLFLGDNGVYLISIFFGFYLIKIYLSNQFISPYFIAVLLWYPAYENLFSLIRKFRKKLSPLLPDTYHLHQLLFYYLKKNFFKKNIIANGMSANLINFYNGIVFLIAATNVSSTEFQLLIISANVAIYSLLYLYLYKFRIKKIK